MTTVFEQCIIVAWRFMPRERLSGSALLVNCLKLHLSLSLTAVGYS